MHPLVDRYLRDLRDALRDVPARQRDELLAEISAHIEESLPEDPSEAQVRSALERLGDPQDIADSERERLGIEPARAGWVEWLAIPLLLLGGVVIPGLGWFVGVVLLWLSKVWSPTDKLMATLLVPGGLLPAVYLLLVPTSTETCSNGTCAGGQSTAASIALFVLFVALVAAPIFTAVRLTRRARRP